MKFPFTIFIVFLVLKLFHVIDWSWWWVVSPIWIFLSWVVFAALVCAIFGFTLIKNDELEKDKESE